MYSEGDNVRTNLPVHLVHAAWTTGDDSPIVQHLQLHFHRIAGGPRNLPGYDMVNIIPLGMQHTAMLSETKSLIENIRTAPTDENVICKICRRHRCQATRSSMKINPYPFFAIISDITMIFSM